jgi:hypothetical protein
VLPPGSFRLLTEAGAWEAPWSATTAAPRSYVVVIAAAPERCSARLRGSPPSAGSRPVPADPAAAADRGGHVWCRARRAHSARARHLESEIGRVFVRYSAGQKDRDAAVATLNVVVQ